ncbi:MAG: homoserine kinase [Dehalococcoidia bacterium]
MIQQRVAVQVPATTANLGPGFDCLGLALDIFNRVSVELAPALAIEVSGEGQGAIPTGEDNLVYRGVAEVFHRTGHPQPGLRLTCHNEIPLARGLGSSAAAVAGGLVAANLLLGEPLSREELLVLGAAIEGHPDNLAPALFGGCQVVVAEGEGFLHAPVPLPAGLMAVLFIPHVEVSTVEARGVLPAQVPLADAVYNLGRAALLVAALGGGELSLISVATGDRLHQPYRERLFPAVVPIMSAATGAGALGSFLSGAGPTVLALCTGGEESIGNAMKLAAMEAGVSGVVRLARPVMEGAIAEVAG